MNRVMLHFNTISDLCKASGFPPPAHSQISLIAGLTACPLDGRPFTTNCYLISLKRFKDGVMLYGRTAYDHNNGSLSFVKPRQIVEFRNLDLEEDSFMICMHEDYLNGHPLQREIQQYHYFDYETTEALHLAPREEQIVWDLFRKIDAEYNNNQDEYSRIIILTHIDSILKYALRFYKRQFINRAVLSGSTITMFNNLISDHIRTVDLHGEGLPSVRSIAAKLHLSPRYLSDLLKQETGKTAIELIHIALINEAKNRLRTERQNVSEVAFQLGFENPSYFTRVFKKQTGITPEAYKRRLLN